MFKIYNPDNLVTNRQVSLLLRQASFEAARITYDKVLVPGFHVTQAWMEQPDPIEAGRIVKSPYGPVMVHACIADAARMAYLNMSNASISTMLDSYQTQLERYFLVLRHNTHLEVTRRHA